MNLSELKLAVYLDEAGDDLESACKTLVEHNIHYVVLRHVWQGHICKADDQFCQRVRQALISYNLSAVAIISDLGRVPTSKLQEISKEELLRVFNLASYFKISHLKFGIGIKGRDSSLDQVSEWMTMIVERTKEASIMPLLEIMDDSVVAEPAAIAKLLTQHKQWRLLYDPVQLIVHKTQDPFVKYWTLLKSFIGAIDLRDWKTGHGFKPVGFGDAKIVRTITDAIRERYLGWFYLEPSLGRRYGGSITRSESFRFAMEALQNVVTEI